MRGVFDRLGWLLAGILAIITVLAVARVVAGGPLDPATPPASTDSVKLPGTPISSLPYSITAPGHYYVTRDLTGVSGQHGIEINASDVSIDLGGFTLRGVAGSLNGIYSPGTVGDRLRISQGTLTDWGGKGIGLSTSNDVVVEDVRVRYAGGIGIELPGNGVLRRCYVIGSGSFGVVISKGLIEDCESHLNAGSGFQIEEFSVVSGVVSNNNDGYGITAGQGTVIRDCIVAENGVGGMYLSGSAVEISACTIMNNVNLGLEISAADVLVRDSIVVGNTTDGIYTESDHLTVRDSEVSHNGRDGIVVTDHNAHLAGVTLRDNASDGAVLYTGSVHGCEISGNGGYGINASGVVAANECRPVGNTSGAATNSVSFANDPEVWSQSLASNNGADSCSSTRFECVLAGTAVLDRQTGLVWERDPDDATTRSWADAHRYCVGRLVGGVLGWRLPTIEELFSLIVGSPTDLPAGHPFPGTFASEWWSATTAWDSVSDGVGMRFFIGVGIVTGAKTSLWRAWCVRGGAGHDGM